MSTNWLHSGFALILAFDGSAALRAGKARTSRLMIFSVAGLVEFAATEIVSLAAKALTENAEKTEMTKTLANALGLWHCGMEQKNEVPVSDANETSPSEQPPAQRSHEFALQLYKEEFGKLEELVKQLRADPNKWDDLHPSLIKQLFECDVAKKLLENPCHISHDNSERMKARLFAELDKQEEELRRGGRQGKGDGSGPHR